MNASVNLDCSNINKVNIISAMPKQTIVLKKDVNINSNTSKNCKKLDSLNMKGSIIRQDQ